MNQMTEDLSLTVDPDKLETTRRRRSRNTDDIQQFIHNVHHRGSIYRILRNNELRFEPETVPRA